MTVSYPLRLEQWDDLRTGENRVISYRQLNQPSFGRTQTFGGATRHAPVTEVTVDYANRIWTRTHYEMPLAVKHQLEATIANPFSDHLRFRLVGRERIGPQEAFLLDASLPPAPARATSPILPTSVDVWVAATNLRVLRIEKYRGAKLLVTSDYRWLPRTRANLADLVTRIPPGYAEGSDGGRSQGTVKYFPAPALVK